MSPPPSASWFNKTETSKHDEMHCRKFRKPCNGDRRDEESPFFDCWDGKHEQSDVVQQVNPWARNAPKSVPSVKSCRSVNFHVCSVCQKLGVYQHLRSRVPQYDISSEGEVDLMKFQLKLPRVTPPQERVVSSAAQRICGTKFFE